MTYFLDTDICVYVLNNRFPSLLRWIQSLSPEKVKISAVVQAELLFGALKSNKPDRGIELMEEFLEPFQIVPFDRACASVYAKIRFDLERKGTPVGPNDLLIASTVLTHQGTLVTHNTKEFSRIHGLKIQDWTKEN